MQQVAVQGEYWMIGVASNAQCDVELETKLKLSCYESLTREGGLFFPCKKGGVARTSEKQFWYLR